MKSEDTGDRAQQQDASVLANDATEKLQKYMQMRSQSSKSMSETLERLQRHIASLNSKARQREEFISQLTESRDKLQAEVAALEKSGDESKAEHAAEIKSLKESISGLSSKIESVEAEKASIDKRKAKVEDALEAANDKIAELEKSIANIQHDADQKVSKVMAAADRGKRAMKLEHDEAIAKLQGELRDRNQRINKLEHGNKALREENANLGALTVNLQNMIDTLFESEMSNSNSFEGGEGSQSSFPSTVGAVREQVSQDKFREAGSAAPVVQLKAQA